MLDLKTETNIRDRTDDLNKIIHAIKQLPKEYREAIRTALYPISSDIDIEQVKEQYYIRLNEIFKQYASLQQAIQYVGIQQTGNRFEVWVVVQSEARKDAVYTLTGLLDDFLEPYGYETVSHFFCPEYHGQCFPENFEGNTHVSIHDNRVSSGE